MQKKIFGLANLLICSLLLNLTSCFKNDRYEVPPKPVDPCIAQPGPLFIEVRAVMTQNCISCHNTSNLNGNLNGTMSWTIDCNIVNHRDRIKARAVDEGTMPPTGPLTQADRNKISAWITAGGAITN